MLINTGLQEIDQILMRYLPENYFADSKVCILGKDYQWGAQDFSDAGYHLILLVSQDAHPRLNLACSESHVIVVNLEDHKRQSSLIAKILGEVLFLQRRGCLGHSDFGFIYPRFQEIFPERHANNSDFGKFEVLVRARFGKGKEITPDAIVDWLSPRENAQIFAHLAAVVFSKYGEFNRVFSFNLDFAAFRDDLAFRFILKGLRSLNGARAAMEIEITESEFDSSLDERNKIRARFKYLKSKGVSFALDDFGVRNSNFDRLGFVSDIFDVIKIDKSLFAACIELAEPDKVANKLSALIGLLPSSHAAIVIEGVETAEHAEIISELQQRHPGREILSQGFYYGLPSTFPYINPTMKVMP